MSREFKKPKFHMEGAFTSSIAKLFIGYIRKHGVFF